MRDHEDTPPTPRAQKKCDPPSRVYGHTEHVRRTAMCPLSFLRSLDLRALSLSLSASLQGGPSYSGGAADEISISFMRGGVYLQVAARRCISGVAALQPWRLP